MRLAARWLVDTLLLFASCSCLDTRKGAKRKSRCERGAGQVGRVPLLLPHQHTAYCLATEKLGRGEEGGDGNAEHAVDVHALARLEEVRDGGTRREKRARQVATVTADAVGRSAGRAGVAMISPGRGGGHALDGKAGREGDVFAESLLAELRRYGLPSVVSGVLRIMLGVPSEEAVDAGRDGVQDVERGDGARVGCVRRTAGDEIAGGDAAAVVVPERFVVVVDADVAVEVWDGGVGRVDVQGEEAERVPERLNALAVDPSEEAAVGRDEPDGGSPRAGFLPSLFS